jgi:hypothetical protein
MQRNSVRPLQQNCHPDRSVAVEGSAVSPSHSQLQPESPLSPYYPDRSGGICSALRLSPILPGKGPGATNSQSNPYPQPDFAMPGGNTRLSNKINPTESINELIWTALKSVCVDTVEETAGPSTTLRSGRDDNSVARRDYYSVASIPASTELSSRPERSVVEGPAVSSPIRKSATSPAWQESHPCWRAI